MPAVDKLIEAAIQRMKDLGAEIVDPAPIETDGQFSKSEFEVLLYEFKADLNAYLSQLPASSPVHSIQDVIDFNEQHQEQVMPYFGQDRMLLASVKGPLTHKRYLDALAKNHRLTRAEGIDAVLFKHNLDALVAPTASPAWLIDWVNGDHFSGPGHHLGCRRGWLSPSHRSRWLCLWPARRSILHRQRLAGAAPHPPGLRLRASLASPPPTPIFT